MFISVFSFFICPCPVLTREREREKKFFSIRDRIFFIWHKFGWMQKHGRRKCNDFDIWFLTGYYKFCLKKNKTIWDGQLRWPVKFWNSSVFVTILLDVFALMKVKIRLKKMQFFVFWPNWKSITGGGNKVVSVPDKLWEWRADWESRLFTWLQSVIRRK